MKPLHLHLQAFGPYSQIVDIDFSKLNSGGLLLIHGQTGSGKTSILDGICYALFGSASGDDRDGEGMRCDLAQADTATEARLYFQVGESMYKVERRPRQQLLKKRGQGLTTFEAIAKLYRYEFDHRKVSDLSFHDFIGEDHWQIQATGVSKVNDIIRELVGMDAKQFRQIVVLPQGLFRRFLSAGSTDRERILENLFKTQHYRTFVEKLAAKADQLEKEIREKQLIYDNQLSSFGALDLEQLKVQKDEIQRHLDESTQKIPHLESQLRQLRAHLETVNNIVQALLDRQQAIHVQTKLNLLRPEIDLKKVEIENSLKSQPIKENHDRMVELSHQSRILEEKVNREISNSQILDEEFKNLSALIQPFIDNANFVQEWQSELQVLREHHKKADQLQRTKKRFDEQTHTFRETEALLSLAEQEFNNDRVKLTNLKIEIQNEDVQPEIFAKVKSDHDTALSLSEQIESTLLLGQEHIEQQRLFKFKQTSLFNLENQMATTLLHHHKIKAQYHHSQAAWLAKNLKLNEPCMVCGSLSHPSPAQLECDSITSDDIENSNREVSEIEKQVSFEKATLSELEKQIHASFLRMSGQFVKAREQIKKLIDQSQGIQVEGSDGTLRFCVFTDESTLLEQGSILLSTCNKIKLDLFDKINRFEKRMAKKSELTMQISNLESRILTTETKRAQLSREFETIRSERQSLQAVIRQLEDLLPESYRDLDQIVQIGQKLRHRLDEHTRQLSSLKEKLDINRKSFAESNSKSKALCEEKKDREKTIDQLHHKMAEITRQQGFATLESALAANLSAQEFSRINEIVKSFELDMAVNQAKLTDVATRLTQLESATDRQILLQLTAEMKSLAPTAVLPAQAVPIQNTDEVVSLPSLLQIKNQLEATEVERTKLIESSSELRERLDRLNRAISKAEGDHQVLDGLRSRFRHLGRLAKVAQGQAPHNLTGVNFQRYLLSSQLDEVLDQASRRLFEMSRGQYRLKRKLDRNDRRMQSGLDLEVEDSFSGTSRPTAYLSGGEGFLASLALALGLADVVQSHLGGIHLDTIFIDEGFGTLDPEALELAMKTLSELQAGGRIVGIVSHVPELREQIPNRLFVRKSPLGSKVEWDTQIG